MPSRLETLQREFTASIVGPRARRTFVGSIRGGGRLSSPKAVEVYRRAYPARMSEALGETYEACWRMLGDEDFLDACAIYARKTPSRSHDLGDYGQDFPEFLQRRFRLPWLGDLGRLCWEFKQLFHEKAGSGLSARELARSAGPASRLTLVDSRRRLAFRHSVHALWSRDRADDTPVRREQWLGPEKLLLYKSGSDDVWARRLSDGEDACLAALERGAPLGDAAKKLSAPQARGFFEFLGSSGLAASVRP